MIDRFYATATVLIITGIVMLCQPISASVHVWGFRCCWRVSGSSSSSTIFRDRRCLQRGAPKTTFDFRYGTSEPHEQGQEDHQRHRRSGT